MSPRVERKPRLRRGWELTSPARSAIFHSIHATNTPVPETRPEPPACWPKRRRRRAPVLRPRYYGSRVRWTACVLAPSDRIRTSVDTQPWRSPHLALPTVQMLDHRFRKTICLSYNHLCGTPSTGHSLAGHGGSSVPMKHSQARRSKAGRHTGQTTRIVTHQAIQARQRRGGFRLRVGGRLCIQSTACLTLHAHGRKRPCSPRPNSDPADADV